MPHDKSLSRPGLMNWTGLVARIVSTVQTWAGRSSARAGLAKLDPHMLRDIGVHADEAAHEATKPFWRA